MCKGTVGILALGYGYIAVIILSTNLYHRLTVDLNHLVEPLQKLNKGEVLRKGGLSFSDSIGFFNSLLLSIHEQHLET